MILQELEMDVAEFERGSGWEIKPEGACHDVRCVPLAPGTVRADRIDVRAIAQQLQMPIVADDARGLWALGPEAGGRTLVSAVAPDLVLPDWRGQEFRLAGLRGLKVLLLCWASW
jgi:hypothetical protein